MSKIEAVQALTTGKGTPFENALAKGFQFIKTRHGGLELGGSLVTHEDLEPAADKLEVTPETLRNRLADEAYVHHQNNQRQFTAGELFDKIREALPGIYRAKTEAFILNHTNIIPADHPNLDILVIGTAKDKRDRLLDSVLEACYNLQISITTNFHSSFFMTRKDEAEAFNIDQLEEVFQSFIEAAGINGMNEPNEGKRLLQSFLIKLRH